MKGRGGEERGSRAGKGERGEDWEREGKEWT